MGRFHAYYCIVQRMLLCRREQVIYVEQIVAYFRAVEQTVGASKIFTATVSSTGEVYYVVPVIRTLPCVHKTDEDGLVCSFTVGSWNLPTDYLTVTTAKDEVDTSLLGTYVDPSYKIKSI